MAISVLKMLVSALTLLGVPACHAPTSEAVDAVEENTMHTSPLLNEAEGLAGNWHLAGPEGDCALELSARNAPVAQGSLAAPMQALTIAGDCLRDRSPQGWRPVPLGLELDNADGMAILTFEHIGEATYRSTDGAWTLTRR